MSNATLVNFAAGETSPRSRGRFDAPWYHSSAQKLLNYLPEVPGPARYRTGFRQNRQTRGGDVARLVPFQLNRDTMYMLEFTGGFFRAYKNGEIITERPTTLTALTSASPGVATFASVAGYATGDEIIITNIVGTEELNGRTIKLGTKVGSTFALTDPVTNQPINTAVLGAYVSGGDIVKITTTATPYQAGELDDIQYASNNETMYVTHIKYAPRKLTVDAADVFTFVTYVRTNDPFVVNLPNVTVGTFGVLIETDGTVGGAGTIGLIWLAPGAVVDENAVYTFAGVIGTVELNGLSVRLKDLNTSDTGQSLFSIIDPVTGLTVDTTGWTPWISGGTGTPAPEAPIAVAFYEGRLIFAGTNQRPNTLFLSRAPASADGATRYDDFTGGANDDDAAFFTLAPISGQVDFIAWARATADFLYVGTFGGPFRISGGGLDQPISPSSINVRQVDTVGCEATMPAGGARLFFLQRGGTSLRDILLNLDTNAPQTRDLNLNAEHIPYSQLRRVVFQSGRPDSIWVVREDGILAGMTVHGNENITGWHRHEIGGISAKVLDAQVRQRTDKNDELWIVTERTVGGVERRYVETQADDVVFPDIEDFFTTEGNEDADERTYFDALYRLQGRYIHLDGAGTYNGSDRGVAAGATATPGATAIGVATTIIASAAVFTAADVGDEIWKKPDAVTGLGSGRAVITGFNSTTSVNVTILSTFDSTDAIPAGDWYITTKTVLGLWYLTGTLVDVEQRVAVVADGAVVSDGLTDDYPDIRVNKSNGSITVEKAAAEIHVGLPYEGIIQSQNLEVGGRTGPAQAKPRNIVEMFIRFLHTLGTSYGTDLYKMEQIHHRKTGFVTGRPNPVFSGIRPLPYADDSEGAEGKHAIVVQRLPLPSVVQHIGIRYDTGDNDE